MQDLNFGEYPGCNDNWMDVISSQGSSLLSVDLSGSDVTDSGLFHLKHCKNLQALNLNYCDLISDHGLEQISGRIFFSTSYDVLFNPINAPFQHCVKCVLSKTKAK